MSTIRQIQWARLRGQRPRPAGANARLGPHGSTVSPPMARVTLSDGASGWGWAHLSREQAQQLVGRPLDEVFDPARGAVGHGSAIEFPLWDLPGKRAGKPVYALTAAVNRMALPEAPLRVRCYDTSLYMDDLHLRDDVEAADLLAAEARDGLARGHRSFKMKIGRGAMHMELEAGTRRDIAVIRAVRRAIGPDATLLLDANNGYNLNLTKRVLSETADCNIFFMEEAFHEDPILYRALREWLEQQKLAVLIADGEGDASPHLMNWAREGIIDVIQYDIFRPGLTRWLEIARQLDQWKVRAAPHHYGGFFGNFATGHLAPAMKHFAFVEWDAATLDAVDTAHYTVEDGLVTLPSEPGFGLALDESVFTRAVKETGFAV